MQQVQTARYVSRLTRDSLALILAGGQGTRLKHMTLWRAKPACRSAASSGSLIFRCPIA